MAEREALPEVFPTLVPCESGKVLSHASAPGGEAGLPPGYGQRVESYFEGESAGYVFE